MHGRWEDAMALKILPHGRLQDWVAEEQGYFAAEGLAYTFLPEGDGAGISCACHRPRTPPRASGPAASHTREVFATTQAWTRRVFPALPEPAPYDEAILA
jgi:hypothetical protein